MPHSPSTGMITARPPDGSHGNARPAQKVKGRFWVILGVLAYVGCFHWVYVNYLYPEFAYYGYDYNRPGPWYVALAWILSSLPSLWMPLEITRPSMLAYWVLYLTVLIPSMFVPLFAALTPAGEISVLMLVLFAGFVIIGMVYRLPLIQLPPVRVSKRAFWFGLGSLAAILMLWTLVVFHSSLQIVSFMLSSELRQTAEDVMKDSKVNYAFLPLVGAINPFLMGWGLFYKRRWMVVIGALGQLLIFMAVGFKSAPVSVAFILGFYILFRLRRPAFAVKLMIAALLFIGTPALSYYRAQANPSVLQQILFAVIFQRTLSYGGLATAQYYDFFQKNQLTYLSNVHGVNWFLHYPYRYSIGEEIGLAYAGTTDLDATAHFWAMDGIAGFGLWGILLVSVLCALIFWAVDSAAQRRDPRLTAMQMSFGALFFANSSLFTTLLSGGFGLLMLLFYLMPDEKTPESLAVTPGPSPGLAARPALGNI